MSVHTRFQCPSMFLALPVLLKQTRTAQWIGLGLAVLAHAAFSQVARSAQEQKAAKPLTTQFVKRQPRLTKPLELKKRPQPRQRQMQRAVVAVKAQAHRAERASLSEPSRLLQGFARPRISPVRGFAAEKRDLEPQAIAQAIETTRETRDVVDLSLEMLDIEALDTGKYHALVVQDPRDRQNIRGFCHLAIVYSRTLYPPPSYWGWEEGYSFESFILPGFLRLPAIMNQYTRIRTDILGRLSLDDAGLFRTPWLLFVGRAPVIQLTPSEFENLGRYVTSGGFVFADVENHYTFLNPAPRYLGLRNCLLGALATQGIQGVFERLPNEHPIYHCYFDFDGPPPGMDGYMRHYYPDSNFIVQYLEGFEVAGRLTVLLSGKMYVCGWQADQANWGNWDCTRAHRFAVNTIIFALTQEGSITQRVMDSVEY